MVNGPGTVILMVRSVLARRNLTSPTSTGCRRRTFPATRGTGLGWPERSSAVPGLSMSTPSSAVVDRVAARGAVGHDDGVVRRLAHGRQQRQLAHGERGIDRLRTVAERARHAAAARLDGLDREAGNELEDALDRREGLERFL